MKILIKTILSFSLIGSFSLLTATPGSDIYKKCAGCHGTYAEKKALNKSQIIAGWDQNKTIAALNGYKDGTYGGPMKGLMKGQVSSLSESQIKDLASFIEGIKDKI